MPDLSTISISLFGISALVAGLQTLLAPSTSQSAFELPPSALPAIKAMSLASIAMGIYYNLAAYQNNRAFYALSVPMRTLTAIIFWGQGGLWKTASVWEGGSAALTGLALLWELRSRNVEKRYSN